MQRDGHQRVGADGHRVQFFAGTQSGVSFAVGRLLVRMGRRSGSCGRVPTSLMRIRFFVGSRNSTWRWRLNSRVTPAWHACVRSAIPRRQSKTFRMPEHHHAALLGFRLRCFRGRPLPRRGMGRLLVPLLRVIAALRTDNRRFRNAIYTKFRLPCLVPSVPQAEVSFMSLSTRPLALRSDGYAFSWEYLFGRRATDALCPVKRPFRFRDVSGFRS